MEGRERNSFTTRLKHYLLATSVCAAMAACGGDGGSGGSSGRDDGGVTSSAVETLLFYTGEDGGGKMSLHAVDPRNPGNPGVIESELAELRGGGSGSRLASVTAGTPEGEILKNAHKAWVVYASSDGHLYRVSTKFGEQVNDVPDPIRISSEDNVDAICDLEVVADYADPLDSVVRYDLPDGTGSCVEGDDTTMVARLKAGREDAPTDFDYNPPMSPSTEIRTDIDSQVRDADTGALMQLVYVGGDDDHVRHFDVDTKTWNNAHSLDPDGTSSYNGIFTDEQTGRMLLKAASGGELRLYDPVAETSETVDTGPNVPDPLPTVEDAMGLAEHIVLAAGFDPVQLFALDFTAASPQLVRVSEGGYRLGSYNLDGIVSAGAQRVAWSYQSTSDPDQDDILESVQLDGSGTPEVLASGDLVTRGVESPATPDDWVYYGAWESSLEFTGVKIQGPGSGEVPLGAGAIGNTWSPNLYVAGERAARVLLDDGGDLVSVDASAPGGGGRIDHGPVPAGLEGARRVTYASSFAPTALVRMERNDVTEEDDVVFIDTRTSSSVTRVTDDANVDARPVEGF